MPSPTASLGSRGVLPSSSGARRGPGQPLPSRTPFETIQHFGCRDEAYREREQSKPLSSQLPLKFCGVCPSWCQREGRNLGVQTHRCVMLFSRPQKTGWGSGRRLPAFFPFPPVSVFMCFAFSPCTKTASRALQRVLAFPSSLVTTASEETYCFCSALIALTSCFLISCNTGGAGLGSKDKCQEKRTIKGLQNCKKRAPKLQGSSREAPCNSCFIHVPRRDYQQALQLSQSSWGLTLLASASICLF